MTKHIPWITVILLFCLVVTVKRAESSDTCKTEKPSTPTQSLKSKGKNIMLPILVIGAGVACLFYCDDEAPVEPMPVPGPAVKNDVTPDNLNDKPIGIRLY